MSLLYEQVTDKVSPKLTNVSAMVKALDELCDELRRDGFGNEVLRHVGQGLKAKFSEFSELKEKVQPLMEMNQYLLQRMMVNHHETFRFWQELAAEAMASYTPDGVQKNDPNASIISVEA